jgi:signal transduction histidine kinase
MCFFVACNRPGGKRDFNYNGANLDTGADSVVRKHGREKAMQFIDSVYRQMPVTGKGDKVNRYAVKARIATADHSIPSDTVFISPIPYLDTIAGLIEGGASPEVKKIYARVLLQEGRVFYNKRDYDNASMLVAKAMQVSKSIKDSCLVFDNLHQLATIVFAGNNAARAIELNKEAQACLEFCRENYYFNKQRVLDDLGFMYRDLYGTSRQRSFMDSAVFYHKKAAEFVIENKNMQTDTLFPYQALLNIYANLGYTYWNDSNYRQAIYYHLKTLEIQEHKTHASGFDKAETQLQLARGYLAENQVDSAEYFMKKMEPYADEINVFFKKDYYELRVSLAKKSGKKDDLVFFQDKLIGRLVFNINDMASARANDPQLEYEKLDKKYQTQLLQRDNRIQRNKTTAAVLIGSVLLIGIVLSVWLLSRLRKLVKRKEVLNHQLQVSLTERERIEKELREKELSAQEMELNMEFQAAILEQRRQISDDMHDELSSSLAALKFFVADLKEQAGGGEPGKILREIEAEVSSVYTNARGYMHSLKTNDWRTRFSLTGLLKDVQQKFRQKNLMDVVLKIDEEGIKHRLSTSQHDQLYHITKECVSNVIKHANATRLEIRVLFGHGVCHFEIQDNSRGFDENKVTRGIGLESIAKRVTGMGGTVDIQSSGMGTTISGSFPAD